MWDETIGALLVTQETVVCLILQAILFQNIQGLLNSLRCIGKVKKNRGGDIKHVLLDREAYWISTKIPIRITSRRMIKNMASGLVYGLVFIHSYKKN